jgi:hypothetical protein
MKMEQQLIEQPTSTLQQKPAASSVPPQNSLIDFFKGIPERFKRVFSNEAEPTEDMPFSGQPAVRPERKPLPTNYTAIANKYLPSLIKAESGGKHLGKDGKILTSNKGARGVAQIMPKTGKNPGYGVTPLRDDSEGEHRRFALDYFTAMVKTFDGDVEKAAAAYNAGVGTVKKAMTKAEETGKSWLNYLPVPEETIPYVNKITGSRYDIVKPKGYGKRADGSEKGTGFLGELKRPDGGVSTELSIGVEFDGKEQEIPMLVPSLSKKEVDHLLKGGEPTDSIVDKAVAHARERKKQGKSPFKQKGEK